MISGIIISDFRDLKSMGGHGKKGEEKRDEGIHNCAREAQPGGVSCGCGPAACESETRRPVAAWREKLSLDYLLSGSCASLSPHTSSNSPTRYQFSPISCGRSISAQEAAAPAYGIQFALGIAL